MAVLHIVRGLPGSGKSTLAEKLAGFNFLYAADDFMIDPNTGRYEFNPNKLRMCHAACFGKVAESLLAHKSCVVHNTFTRSWEYQPYIDLATRMGCDVQVHDLFDAGLTDAQLAARCIHGVPEERIAEMRSRYER